MNKKDVIDILEVLNSEDYFSEFTLRKCDCSLIKKAPWGWQQIHFAYYNSYDLEREELALEFTPAYGVRFHVLHKWFEKFSLRTLSDQRDSDSIGFVGHMLGRKRWWYFLENRTTFWEDYRAFRNEVITVSSMVFPKFQTLGDLYQYRVVDVMEGKRELPTVGFEWSMEILTLAKIVAPQDYTKVKDLIMERIDSMYGRKEPNVCRYYDRLPEILSYLESLDFTKEKLLI